MRQYNLLVLLFFALFSCHTPAKDNPVQKMNLLAEKYVRLGLFIGQYDSDFVDAYYGPDSLKPVTSINKVFPKDSVLEVINELQGHLKTLTTVNQDDSIGNRARWMISQLTAFSRRVNIFSGTYDTFDKEALQLFGVTVPAHDENHFRLLVAKFDSILPGRGEVAVRFNLLAERFIIPKNKLDTVFKRTIAEARKRTLAHYTLPATEGFTLEYVTGKPWSGYNWYQGGYKSVIQINTDLPVFIERAIDLACHEGYPGHHVYNLLLEKNLYRDRGWVEVSLYPLFSPQSLIAEGSANFGIALAFPGNEQHNFIRDTLLPLAGLDTSGITNYLLALSLKKNLNYVRNEVGRGLVNGSMTENTALQWLTDYGLYTREAALKSIGFIKKYRSYVINYNYGQELVADYIEAKGGVVTDMSKRWELFEWLLSNEVMPSKLLPENK